MKKTKKSYKKSLTKIIVNNTNEGERTISTYQSKYYHDDKIKNLLHKKPYYGIPYKNFKYDIGFPELINLNSSLHFRNLEIFEQLGDCEFLYPHSKLRVKESLETPKILEIVYVLGGYLSLCDKIKEEFIRLATENKLAIFLQHREGDYKYKMPKNAKRILIGVPNETVIEIK